ncbi:hypothetical protein NMY22_g7088 [Coprinellus aureogranulatus]|nr:hypothetical protein NMY22_g7088 [Coprinellus aureogranulatus]
MPTANVSPASLGALDTASKRLANSTLPISRLPPELLAQIMGGSLTFLDLTWENAWENNPRPHPCISLCHVSSAWREIALAFPELWSRIQIFMSTSSSELEFVWANASSMPVELEFCGAATGGNPRPKAFTVISRILRTELNRVKSLRTQCAISVLKVLLAEITGLAGSLEVLEVSGFRMDAGDPWAIETGKEFIVGGAPRLRFIAPTALTLPWESTCLKSPTLTRVTLEQTAPGIDRLFGFLRDTPQLEVFEIGRLPWTDGEAFTPSAYPLVVMPNLKQLALSSYEWNPICTALSTIRMPLSAAQEKQVATFGGGPLKTGTWDLRAAYISSLLEFFGGVIAPEEMEMYQEGDRGWEAVKVWMKHRAQWPKYDAHENGRPTLTFEDRDEWIKLGYGREWAFTPPLHYQSLWSLENLRVITVNETDDWAYGIPRDFWTLLGRLPKLEVIVVGAQKGFALQLFEELGKKADGISVSNDSASRFPSLRAIVLNWSAAPSDPIYLDRDLGFNGRGDLEDTVTHLLQAFQSGDRRMLDELKLVFDAVLESEDAALLRGVLSRLEEGGIAKRVGVWDMDRELHGEPNTI